METNFIDDKFTIDELFQRSWNYRGSKDFIRFFEFISSMNHYSRYNTMLVYTQNSAVTFFGGTAYWRKKNRYVKEDARPYVILAPKGPVMLVYDIFETTGEITPDEFLEKGIGKKIFEVKGTIDPKKLQRMIGLANDYGIKIGTKPLSYFNAGYITTRFSGKLEIYLREGQTIEESISVLIHELAHLFLGHTSHKNITHYLTSKQIKLPQRKLTHSLQELEAETVSFLITKKLGLETRAFDYIAGYMNNDEDLLKFSYETVIKTADNIEKLFLK